MERLFNESVNVLLDKLDKWMFCSKNLLTEFKVGCFCWKSRKHSEGEL